MNGPLDGRALFAQVAPFLERCHRERKAELVSIGKALRQARVDELKLERLVAHRELQQLRAGNTRNRKYVAHRTRKLEQAQGALDRVRSYIRRMEAA